MHFSSFLNPVVVFLVFSNFVFVCFNFDTNWKVVVDILDRCCKKLRIVLSTPKMIFAFPRKVNNLELMFIGSPSWKKNLVLIVGNFFF